MPPATVARAARPEALLGAVASEDLVHAIDGHTKAMNRVASAIEKHTAADQPVREFQAQLLGKIDQAWDFVRARRGVILASVPTILLILKIVPPDAVAKVGQLIEVLNRLAAQAG